MSELGLHWSGRLLQERELWFSCGQFRMRYFHLSASEPKSDGAPALVLVHGLLGYSFSWRHNLESFAQHRDVYSIDLLGIGYSDRPEPGKADFSFAAASGRLLEFLRGLGHSQIDLVGTSHGGSIAMQTASMDHDSGRPLIRRLVLVAPANPFMKNARFRIAFFRTALGRRFMRLLADYGTANFRIRLLGRMYGDSSRITQETRDGYALNLDDPSSYEYALDVVRTWKEDMDELRARLKSIADIPTLLLWGADDRVVSAKSGLLLRDSFRNAQYVTLPGIGHLPYEEAPDEFNRRVLGFLNS